MSTVENIRAAAPVPTHDELVARARAMIPALKERAVRGAEERVIPVETVAEMQEAGLFRVLQPRRWGGYEMRLETFYEVLATLAEGDMSAAWIYGVIAVHPWQLATFEDRAAQEVWGEDDSVLIASSYMPTGRLTPCEGGYRLSGRWGYSSGSEHCQWTFLTAVPVGPDGPDFNAAGTVLVPRSDYTLVDVWDTAGLRGTGSNDLVIEDKFVPHHRFVPKDVTFSRKLPGRQVNTSPLYAMPFGQVFSRAVSTASIGALQAMINLIIETAKTRVSVFGVATKTDPVVAQALAEAQNEVDMLKLVLYRNCEVLWQYAERDEDPPMDLRTQYRFQASLPPERVTHMAMRLFKAAGGAAVYSRNGYGQILADINTGRQHAANQFEMFARNWGGLMMGQENADTFL
jgi:3-hydroxy-9,10-secoandrosta-1,3,5(10)-triene-9,17-dione monooxygenase